MRTFDAGATRNDLADKLSYMRALSPAVLRRYVQYLAKHRKQADGKLRDFDNWKKGIPPEAYMDSLIRHTFDAWLMSMGCTPSDESYDLEDLLCAIIFNAQGRLFELIHNETREGTVPITDPARALPVPTTELRVCGDCPDFAGNGGACRENIAAGRKRLAEDSAGECAYFRLKVRP